MGVGRAKPRQKAKVGVSQSCSPMGSAIEALPSWGCPNGTHLRTTLFRSGLVFLPAVTAPSSPLSPPVSPVFPPPEPAGSRNGECTVCFDGEVDTVIYTCGHMCLCTSCGLRLKRQARACCPICRRPIKDVIKIDRPRGAVWAERECSIHLEVIVSCGMLLIQTKD